MDKYRINRGDIILATGMDRGSISNYYNGKIKQIRIETDLGELDKNIKNGRNHRLTLIDTSSNPNLGCIQVDNVSYPLTKTCNEDFWCIGPPYNPTAYYSEDCYLSTSEFTKVDFDIYPNPVKDFLSVNSQEPINFLKIYSITGKLLRETAESSINISDLSSGLYFTLISINGRNDTKKFIKI